MKISDEQLMAYADGELDETMRSEIAAAIERDPALAERVRAHERTRVQVHAAFAPVVEEVIPERLIAAVNASPDRSGAVSDLRQARERKEQQTRRRWSFADWGAIAASLLLGIIVGRTAFNSDSEMVVERNGSLIAAGALADALGSQLSSDEGEQRVALSFQSAEGAYCRAFVTGRNAPTAGLACRDGDHWAIRVLSETSEQQAEYETAASALPGAVLAAIDRHILGEPLTIEEEKAAREEQWSR